MITVVAAIIKRDGRILITKRPDHVHLGGLWEFPGGKVHDGESLDQALKREIHEELGIHILVHDECFHTVHHYDARSVALHFFNCTILSGDPTPIDVAEYRWALPRELHEYSFPEADQELIRMIG